jgi:aminopeptidase N
MGKANYLMNKVYKSIKLHKINYMRSIKQFLFVSLVLLMAISCKKTPIPNGVPLNLAIERKAQISEITYKLHFDIPIIKAESISGKVEVFFHQKESKSVTFDFRGTREMVQSVLHNGKPINYTFENGHIIIPKRYTKAGENRFVIEFTSGNGSLNRSDEFLYTLLVPDRASTVFPCFDQPDMKAIFELSLTIPSGWVALSNGQIETTGNQDETTKHITFAPTKPISTYLFAFAAGNFQVESKTVDNRTFTIYHRETDKEKLERNLPIISNLHAKSLAWLEEYTGIPYPFGKLDFILIPGFQYSGMEHPGAIFYRDSRLLLDENPSVNQKLSQANLIAHEVAHQWFGDLVTMQWFNDVWLKEVFAGFMADLIVNPQYPEINHQLSFMLSHFPRAYSVDRTKGANPIVQELDNMLFAGTLYGDIIYHKAPIMMQQLVMLMGEEQFRIGVRVYLKKYYMGNASWDDLVTILDNHTEINLIEWAEIWTKKSGKPAIEYSFDTSSKIITLNALNSSPLAPMWVDICDVNNTGKSKRVWIDKLPSTIAGDDIFSASSNIIINASGIAYGTFIPDSTAHKFQMLNINSMASNVARGSQHISIYEAFLDKHIDTDTYIEFVIKAIEVEKDPQILNYLLGTIKTVYWQFIPSEKREITAKKIETVLWKLLQSKLPVDQRKTVFRTLSSVFLTNESFSKIYTAWVESKILDLTISESDRTKLAYELMIRKPELYHTIAFGEIERINNPDRIAQFDFTLASVSPNPSQRIAFFENLKGPANRKPEPWVTEALYYLHHPLRTDFSLRFIKSSLDMLPEIQETGDIFFPKSWLDATLSGHSSIEALEIVKTWIDNNPTLAPNLKMKLLQSMDMLERAGKE